MANSGIVGALRVLLGLDTAEFDTNIKKVKGQVGDLEGGFKDFGKSFAGAFLPVAGVAGAGLALAAFAKQAFDTSGHILDLAAQTGLTTDSIQEMQAAANLTGTSLESFTNAAFRLGVNLASGTDKIRSSVEALGLSYETLRAQSPDEQFKAIAAALGEVEDVQLRNKLAVELFGKAAKEILPAIADHYDVITGAVIKTEKAQLEAIDHAGNALTAFWTDLQAIGISALGNIVLGLNQLWTDLLAMPRAAFAEWTTVLEAIGLKAAELPNVLDATRGVAGLLPATLNDITLSLEEQARAEKDLDQAAKASLATNLAAIDARRRAVEEAATALRAYYNFVGQRRMEDEAAELQQIEDQRAAWRAYYNWIGERRMEDEDRLQSFREQLVASFDPSLLEPFKAAVIEVRTTIGSLGADIKKGLGTVLSDIPGTLASALQGGGGIGGALKSIASQIGASLGGTIGSLFGPLGKKVGEALGSFGGALVTKIGSWFGIGADAAADFRKEILKSFGSFAELERKAQSVGMTFVDLWQGKGKKGAEALKAAIEQLNKALAEQQRQLEATRQELDAANQSLDGLIDHARDLGYEFDRTGKLVSVSFDKMQASAERFGVDLGSLGPQFKAQKLAATAKDIVDNFELLAKGGADVGGILFGMKDEINALVLAAIKAGTLLPAQMQPWIEELIRAGLLVDENGNKLTDLTGIHFGPPIESEFDKVSRAIHDTIDAITLLIAKIETLINTIAGIPDKDVTVRVTTDYQNGAPPDDEPTPAFAAGGLVRRATRALIGEGGQPELVGPVEFMSDALAGALHNLGGFVLPDVSALLAPALAGSAAPGAVAGAAPPTVINFAFDISTLDTDELSRLIRRRVIPEINAQLSNVGDLRSGMRDGLGI